MRESEGERARGPGVGRVGGWGGEGSRGGVVAGAGGRWAGGWEEKGSGVARLVWEGSEQIEVDVIGEHRGGLAGALR